MLLWEEGKGWISNIKDIENLKKVKIILVEKEEECKNINLLYNIKDITSFLFRKKQNSGLKETDKAIIITLQGIHVGRYYKNTPLTILELIHPKVFIISVPLKNTEEIKKILEKNGFEDPFLSILKEINTKIFMINEEIEKEITRINDKLLDNILDERDIKKLFKMKNSMIYLSKIILENFDLVEDLLVYNRKNNYKLELIKDELRELKDLTNINRELINETLYLHSNNLNFKLNKSIMNLTIFANVIGIPMLITGIYGMNFRFMPEIYWRLGYLFALSLMVFTAILSYFWIKRILR